MPFMLVGVLIAALLLYWRFGNGLALLPIGYLIYLVLTRQDPGEAAGGFFWPAVGLVLLWLLWRAVRALERWVELQERK